jgi:hypothetical protein
VRNKVRNVIIGMVSDEIGPYDRRSIMVQRVFAGAKHAIQFSRAATMLVAAAGERGLLASERPNQSPEDILPAQTGARWST